MNVELIAEVATNHGGNLSLAKEFIHRFAEAGADTIKFQLTRVKHLRRGDPQVEWFTRAELGGEQFAELKAECEAIGKRFLLTCYHIADLQELVTLGCDTVKIGSGESANRDLVFTASRRFRRVLLSAGIAESGIVGLNMFWLRCVSRYPNLDWMYDKAWRFDATQWVGWSDHGVGIDLCRRAIFAGASVIEKHVQLPHQARPPKPWEATKAEFKKLRQFADEDPQTFLGRWQHA